MSLSPEIKASETKACPIETSSISPRLKNFSKFNKHALGKNINVIAGISPGLDFNFKSYIEGNKEELNLLIKKFNTFF